MLYKETTLILLLVLVIPMNSLYGASKQPEDALCKHEFALAKQDMSDFYWVMNSVILEASETPGLTPDGLFALLLNDPTEFVLKLKGLQTVKPHECLMNILTTSDYDTAFKQCMEETNDIKQAWSAVDDVMCKRIQTILLNRAMHGITRSSNPSTLAACGIIGSDSNMVEELPSEAVIHDLKELLTWQRPVQH